MPKSPQEQADLDKLHTEQRRIKDAAFSYLDTLDKASLATLTVLGYPSMNNAEAMRAAYQSYKRQHDQLVAAHVRKYPDR